MMKAITIPAKMTLVLRKSRPHKRLRLCKKGAVNRRRGGGGGVGRKILEHGTTFNN